MKISDVIKQISSIVDTQPLDRSSGDNTSKFTAFTGDLTMVELPDGESEKRREPGKMPSGNDAMPEDLYLPPLQLKSELLKKAVDVENVFSDGTPAQRYDEEYGDEGWHGDESDHDYIGAPQTAEQVPGDETEQPDPNETDGDSRSERERADESLHRILQLANLREGNQHWYKDEYDADAASRKDDMGSIVKRMKAAVAEEWDDDDVDADVERADRELSRMGKSPVKAAVIDIDSDSFGDESCDWDEEEVDEGFYGWGNGGIDDAERRAFKHNELRHELRGEEPKKKSSRPNPMYSRAGGYTSNRMRPGAVGYTFFNIPSGKEKEAERLGLQRTKSGKYALAHIYPDKERYASSIEELEKAFGPGKYWEPKKENTTESEVVRDRSGRAIANDESGYGWGGAERLIHEVPRGWDAEKVARKEGMKYEVDGGYWYHTDPKRSANSEFPRSHLHQDDFDPMYESEDDMEECSMTEAKELNRMKKLAGLNPVVLDELNDDNAV